MTGKGPRVAVATAALDWEEAARAVAAQAQEGVEMAEVGLAVEVMAATDSEAVSSGEVERAAAATAAAVTVVAVTVVAERVAEVRGAEGSVEVG